MVTTVDRGQERRKYAGRSSPAMCPPRASSRRDNLQVPMAPRRQGHWALFPCALGSLGPLPSLDKTRWALWVPSPFPSTCPLTTFEAGPVFGQVPPHRDHVISFSFRPPIPIDGVPLTHSPGGGSQRFRHTKGAHPKASGRHAAAVRERSLRDASLEFLSQSLCSSWMTTSLITYDF